MHRSVLRTGLGGLAMMLVTAVAFAAEGRPPEANLSAIALGADALKERMIEARPIGDVILPSGRIVATDPLVQPEHAPLERTVPPGRYPLTLFVAQGRNALAMLRFAPGKVARWRIATVPGQDASTLKDDEIFGYGVDAGLGSFMGPEAVKAMDRRVRETPRCDNYYDCVLASELTANGADVVLHRPMKDEDINVAVFSSGWGDGFYASYWGFDEAGETIVLVTDFGVIEDGDGRSDFDKRHAAALAAMTPEQRSDSRAGYEALKRDDLDGLKDLLVAGRVTPDTYVEDAGGAFTFEAIRLDKPAALELLARYGARVEMDAATAADMRMKTFLDYARSLDAPRAKDLPLPEGFTPRPPSSAELRDVVARWQAGAIPPASDMPKRDAAAPPPPETPKP